MTADAWNPEQYQRFRAQRMEPLADLVALIRAPLSASGSIVRCIDLGCGTGEATAWVAERFSASTWVGIDSSAAMLAEAAPRGSARLRFEAGDIRDAREYSAFNLVLSNAALQWVPDHEGALRRILAGMRIGAQIAVQVPRNLEQPSHTVAAELAIEEPFASAFERAVQVPATLSLERYAEVLYEEGFREQVCIEKIYGHAMERSGDVVEWVKGTLLNAYLPILPHALRAPFVAAYRARLLGVIGDRSPYFFPFRRCLVWGVREDAPCGATHR